MEQVKFEVGKTYRVQHSRKGTFILLVTSQTDEWVTGTIMEGTAKAMLDRNGLRWVREHFPDIKLPSEFNLGGLVGVVTLRDVVQSSTSPWFFGPVGLVVDGGYPIPFVPQRGQLGLFDLDIPFHYLRRHS